MKEITCKNLIYNNSVKSINNFDLQKISQQVTAYEVMRLVNGIPLFFEDHFCRLIKTMELLNFDVKINENELINQIKLLIHSNDCQNGNVKIVLNTGRNNSKNLYCYFITHYYPDEQEYKNGVKTTLYYAERNNPNAKTVLYNLRMKAEKEKKEKNVYEVILVNKNNLVTEGSRSNLFFIKGETVYTPPLHQVLPGITRKYAIEICKKNNISIIESEIGVNTLNQYTSVFITGTSPKILPVNSIENISFSCNNEILNLIMDKFDLETENYLLKSSDKWK